MMSAGSGLPSSAPVIARISKRAATRLLPWPKLSWAVRNGVVAGSIGLANVTVMCDGAVGGRVGRPAVFVAGVEDVFGAVVCEPGVGRDAGDVEQAVEIHLVAGDGFGAGGEGGEDEGAFVGGRERAVSGSYFACFCEPAVGGVGERAEAAAAAGVLGSGWKTTRRPVMGLSSFGRRIETS